MNDKKKSGRRAATALLALCVLSAPLISGGGCRGRFGNMMSKQQEIDLGRQAVPEIERRYRVDDDPAVNERMQRIAARIFPQAKKDFDAPFSIKVLKSKDVNAFALPGGPIYFYRGLIDLAESDDEIASVLGHEASHVTQHHAAKQISDANGKSLLVSLVTGGRGEVLSNILINLDQLSYSRGDESQADEIGFRYFTAAGYDPKAMASFFTKMKAKAGGGKSDWFASHPGTDDRIRRATQRAAEYEKGRGPNS